MADTITFDATLFRSQIKAYADPTQYPDAILQGFWDMAIQFVSDSNYGYLVDDGRALALNYMTAHLVYLNNIISAGTAPGMVVQSTVDRTSVSLLQPPQRTQWHFWLNQSPYGQALMALLKANAVGGFFAGSQFPRGGFRQPDGSFLC